MATQPTHIAFPSGPLIDATSGDVTPVWRAYFAQLYIRTGGSSAPVDATTLTAALVAERAARLAADAALQSAITIETTQRIAADNAEAATRSAADSAETAARIAADNAIIQALDTERAARIASDALLVPIAQLCAMWAACNLAFLPHGDPGGAKPWIDDSFPWPGHLAVGTAVTAIVGLQLEDASGDWALEDGTGHWIWG
jgi:hypothetical protein